ncbi:MAG: serine protease, partial [Cyanobacteria bacterium J06628_3]
FDRQEYSANWLNSINFGNLDLALVQFTSNKYYEIAILGDSNGLLMNDKVYAAGFPAWHFVKDENTIIALKNTRDWGVRAFRFTTGTVGMFVHPKLKGGYQIGYTNDILQGMSGGPLLNQNGELIGINGKSKYPLRGVEAYIFADGMMPSEQQLRQMEAFSWAVPIANYHQVFGSIHEQLSEIQPNKYNLNSSYSYWQQTVFDCN